MTGREMIAWVHAIHQVTGAMALLGDPGEADLEDWSRRLTAVAREMMAEARRMRPVVKKSTRRIK